MLSSSASKTVGALLTLPPALARALRVQAHRLYRMAAAISGPLDPSAPEDRSYSEALDIRRAMPRGCYFSLNNCSIRCLRCRARPSTDSALARVLIDRGGG